MSVVDDNAMRLRAAVETEIDRYMLDCRGRATAFVNRHFSLRAAAKAHARTARHDVIRHPINLALALPSLILRRAASLCERLGWTRMQALLERIPLPLKTAYETRVDMQVLAEIFELPDAAGPLPSPFTQALLHNEGVAGAVAAEPEALGFLRTDEWLRDEVRKAIKDWAAARAQLIDAVGSTAVLAASYLVFKSSGHGVLEMGRKVASDRARTQAANNFVLGERIGSLFYSIAPVHPTTTQVIIATVIMFAFVGLLTVAVNLLSDPVQRQFAVQHRHLLRVIDGVEERLLSTLRKRLRATGPIPTPLPFAPITDRVPLLDFDEVTGRFSSAGTVRFLAKILAAVTLFRRKYPRVIPIVLTVAIVGGYAIRRATHFDPYDEPASLIEKGAYPTALARLDWLNKNPGYREQAYYWFLRGRATCGMSDVDACTDAYARVLKKDTSYREDEHIIEDMVRNVSHPRAKKIILQELGPEALSELKKAVLGADRVDVASVMEQIGARGDVPYADILKLEVDAAPTCEEKKKVLDRFSGENWKEAVRNFKLSCRDPVKRAR